MKLLFLMHTSCQCNNLSPTQEAAPDHLRMSAWVEQMEECQGAKIKEMESNEVWLLCVMLNGSSWSTEKDFLEGRGAGLDVFIGIEHRLRGEVIDQEWNVYAKKSYKIAAADARSTEDVQDARHTSGVMFAMKKEEASVVDKQS